MVPEVGKFTSVLTVIIREEFSTLQARRKTRCDCEIGEGFATLSMEEWPSG